MNSSFSHHILTANTKDIPGVIASIANILLDVNANVTEAGQFGDDGTGRFYLRMEFTGVGDKFSLETVEKQLSAIEEKFDLKWALHNAAQKPKIVLAVSKLGHCLNDLLFRWETGTLSAEVVAVVSNHDDLREKVEHYGLPFYHLPITKDTKPEQEAKILKVMEDYDADLLVLARYMQILSEKMCDALEGRAINIHHSFLPSFKGAKPYHQAFERGVKIMGATAHYVTSDLDEGPIIEQDILRIEHFHHVEDCVSRGSDVESLVLARAVNWHCERRILLNGHKTVVFK